MASRPDPAQQLTIGERGVQHSQQGYINVDIRVLQNTDYVQPFTNLEDAAQQLFPFHLLAAQDDNEADLDETADHQGAGLLASRQEAWSHWVHTHLAEARRTGEALEQRMHNLYKEVHAATPTPSAIDQFQVELMQKDKAQQQLQVVQGMVRPLQPPPQPVAPLHQHAAPPGVPAMMRAGGMSAHVRPMGVPMPGLHHPHSGAHATPHGWPPGVGVTSPRGLVGLPPGALPPPPLGGVGPGGLAPQPGLVPGMRLPGGPLPGGVRPQLPPHLYPGGLPMGLGGLPLQQPQLLLPLQQQQQHQQHQQRPQ